MIDRALESYSTQNNVVMSIILAFLMSSVAQLEAEISTFFMREGVMLDPLLISH